MNEKKAVMPETRGDYQKAGKKKIGLILDQYIRLTGYNRKYAVRVLSKPFGKSTTVVIGGTTVVCKAEKKPKPKNRPGKPIYTGGTLACIELGRQNIDFLMASNKPDFHITLEIRAQLLTISGRQIDRLLKPAKDALRSCGISGTKNASSSLLKNIPVRVQYSDQERSTPGILPDRYIGLSVRHHCGDSDSGDFPLTLTVTNIASGWLWLYGLPNKAHFWTLEGLQATCHISPFKIIGFHRDNGSEFVNHDTLNWREP
jgi:hypothetical protein